MTFLEVFEKYNLTEKEIHYLKVMKDRSLTKSWIESDVYIGGWSRMINDGILVVDSYSTQGRICKVADFIYE